MDLLPIKAFPINSSSTNSDGFALAVIVGLIIFIAAQKKAKKNASSTR